VRRQWRDAGLLGSRRHDLGACVIGATAVEAFMVLAALGHAGMAHAQASAGRAAQSQAVGDTFDVRTLGRQEVGLRPATDARGAMPLHPVVVVVEDRGRVDPAAVVGLVEHELERARVHGTGPRRRVPPRAQLGLAPRVLRRCHGGEASSTFRYGIGASGIGLNVPASGSKQPVEREKFPAAAVSSV